jgi:competence protein ComEA
MPIVVMAALLCAAAEPPPLPPPAAQDARAPPAAQPAKPRKKIGKPVMIGVLNVNRATEAELRLLPGIGKRRAELIVERRNRKPFASVEEIGRIKGMRALVQRLRARLAVQGDTTLQPLRLDRKPRGE